MGHIIRDMGLERDCLLGRSEGVRARSKQRIIFMDSFLADTGGGWRVLDLVRIAFERNEWHSMVADITRPTCR